MDQKFKDFSRTHFQLLFFFCNHYNRFYLFSTISCYYFSASNIYFRIRHLESGLDEVSNKDKDIPAPTAIFKDFSTIIFTLKFKDFLGFSRRVRTLYVIVNKCHGSKAKVMITTANMAVSCVTVAQLATYRGNREGLN